jgi:hypothetical protein
MFKVTEKRCNECLFSQNKIVSDERRRQVLAECEQNDSHFICHKSSMNGSDVCCRGFYDAKSTNMIRIAQRLDAVEFVPIPDTPNA